MRVGINAALYNMTASLTPKTERKYIIHLTFNQPAFALIQSYFTCAPWGAQPPLMNTNKHIGAISIINKEEKSCLDVK